MSKKSRSKPAVQAPPTVSDTVAMTEAARASRQQARTEAGKTPQQTRAQRAQRSAGRPVVMNERKDERFKTYQKQKQQALYTKIGFGVLALLVVLGGAWWGYGQWRQAKVSDDVQRYFGAGDFAGLHKDGDILYEEVPPVGGAHNVLWQNCGYYSQTINNVNAVHALEHGAVWITYDPKLPADQIQTLKDKTKQTYVLVSPYPGLTSPVVASVWGSQIKLDGASDWRLDAFIKKYRQNPDNTPERGALCTLGTSATTTTAPQTVPFVRTAGSAPVGGVTVPEATATAQALLAGTPTASPPVPPATAEAASGTPAAMGPPIGPPAASPANSPAASPSVSPEASSIASPVATPGT